MFRKHLQFYVRRMEVMRMTSFTELEIRCSVHTYCGSFQSAAHSNIQISCSADRSILTSCKECLKCNKTVSFPN